MAKRTATRSNGSPSTTPPAQTLDTATQVDTRPAPRPRRKARVEIPTAINSPDHAGNTKPRASSGAGPSKVKRRLSTSTVKKGSTPGSAVRPLSALDAAAKVLASLSGKQADVGLSVAALIERMADAKLWTSPGGKTPTATLYAAISREMASKGSLSRFRKVSPGHFVSVATNGAEVMPAHRNDIKITPRPAQSSSKLTDRDSDHERCDARKARRGRSGTGRGGGER